MELHELKSTQGTRKRKKIVGRGPGSGLGKTSGRGHKGQGARAGRGIIRGLEGGQMPLIRRLPKVGFRSHRPVLYQVVNVQDLEKIKKDTVVNAAFLKANGMINSLAKPFKILGNGKLTKSLTVSANSFSKSAEEKIEKAGGKVEVIKKGAVKKEEKASEKKQDE